jgi:hypothetical protein
VRRVPIDEAMLLRIAARAATSWRESTLQESPPGQQPAIMVEASVR